MIASLLKAINIDSNSLQKDYIMTGISPKMSSHFEGVLWMSEWLTTITFVLSASWSAFNAVNHKQSPVGVNGNRPLAVKITRLDQRLAVKNQLD
jgi:hypothetical protein